MRGVKMYNNIIKTPYGSMYKLSRGDNFFDVVGSHWFSRDYGFLTFMYPYENGRPDKDFSKKNPIYSNLPDVKKLMDDCNPNSKDILDLWKILIMLNTPYHFCKNEYINTTNIYHTNLGLNALFTLKRCPLCGEALDNIKIFPVFGHMFKDIIIVDDCKDISRIIDVGKYGEQYPIHLYDMQTDGITSIVNVELKIEFKDLGKSASMNNMSFMNIFLKNNDKQQVYLLDQSSGTFGTRYPIESYMNGRIFIIKDGNNYSTRTINPYELLNDINRKHPFIGEGIINFCDTITYNVAKGNLNITMNHEKFIIPIPTFETSYTKIHKDTNIIDLLVISSYFNNPSIFEKNIIFRCKYKTVCNNFSCSERIKNCRFNDMGIFCMEFWENPTEKQDYNLRLNNFNLDIVLRNMGVQINKEI